MLYHDLDSLKVIVENVVKGVLDEADFGAKVKGDLTEDDILKGEVVYHRPADAKGSDKLATIKSLMKYGFDRDYTSSNGGNMLGIGIYSVYNLRSSNEKARGYGHYIVKAYVLGGFKDFLILNEDIAKKYYGKNYWIGDQIKMLMSEKLANSVLAHLGNRLYMNNNETATTKRTAPLAVQITGFLGSKIEQTKIRGIIYSGGHDGDCAFIRNFKDAIPYAYSSDNGRTWTKAITDELIWRAGHDTDVEATLRNTVDDKGKKVFDDVAARAINGYAIVYKNGKANYFNVAKNDLIGDVWFDYAGNFDKSMDGTLEAEVSYNGNKFTIYEEDGKYIVADEYGCPICYLNDLPNQSLNESVIISEAKNVIDNFNMVASLMNDMADDDFYFVQIIKRAKDNPNSDKSVGNYHAGGWYLKSWRVHNPQQLMSIRDEVIDICNRENARAYVSINPRGEKETNDFIEIYRQKFPSYDARYEHAEDIVPGQAKEGPSWAGKRKRLFLDIDCDASATDYSGRNIWNEVKHMINMVGIVPIGEYVTPNGGLHIILPDKEEQNYYYLKKLLAKFDGWRDKKRRATVHPNVDGKIILYSNVDAKGY